MGYDSSDYGHFILRVSLGVILLAHGLLKVFGFSVPGTVELFGSLGLPPVAAYATIFAEITGGLAITLGIYTRLAAFLTVPVLAGAVWAHLGNGWVFSNAGGGWEFPALLVALAVSIGLMGDGPHAIKKIDLIDWLIPSSLKG